MLCDLKTGVNSKGVRLEMEINTALLYFITLTLPWGCVLLQVFVVCVFTTNIALIFNICMSVLPLLF